MKMKNVVLLFIFTLSSFSLFAQDVTQEDSLSLIFIGDIMGHDPQIQSAFNPENGKYNYESVFRKVSHIIKAADFAIANLEVTLGGEPYAGYPQFSSPDALAVACKKSGIDVLVTANNHSCDRAKKGLLRTIHVLDSLKIPHTGTFKDSTERNSNNLLVLDKNNIRVGLLNYTYGTNGLPTPRPTMVNRIDTLTMLADIRKSKTDSLDKLIVMIHWGPEYQSQPSKKQVEIAEVLFRNGVDIIVGSHPHVLQKMEYFPATEVNHEHFIAYSLGNFVSNQRTRKRDGGAMLKLTLRKNKEDVQISNSGYYLTWVSRPVIDDKTMYEIIPCSQFEAHGFYDLDSGSKEKMKVFMADSRALLEKENVAVFEIKATSKINK
jgi:poly-gamma-glutamate synthesis protein (capsule biosynthesis protein)